MAHVADLIVHKNGQFTGHTQIDMAAEWCGLGKAVQVAQCKRQADWFLEVNVDLVLLLQGSDSRAEFKVSMIGLVCWW